MTSILPECQLSRQSSFSSHPPYPLAPSRSSVQLVVVQLLPKRIIRMEDLPGFPAALSLFLEDHSFAVWFPSAVLRAKTWSISAQTATEYWASIGAFRFASLSHSNFPSIQRRLLTCN